MTKHVIWERKGKLGLITLNRPEALNALSPEMVYDLTMAFSEFEKDSQVQAVVLRGEGKAFCAGGDVRALVEAAQKGDSHFAYEFWFEEYRLNRLIGRFCKPVVSLIGGVVMGGGVGLSMHGSHRVAGENFLFAMPEVGIGFYPDVGGLHILSKLPGQLGRYLALTGARLKWGDAYALGLATHAIESDKFDAICDDLSDGRDVDDTLNSKQAYPEEAPILKARERIDQLFAFENLHDVLEAVRSAANMGDDVGRIIEKALQSACPLSVAVADEGFKRAKGKTLEEVLVQDLRVCMRFVEGYNFPEGIRALLIDKDKNPKWQPEHWFEIREEMIEPYFAPLDRDLSFA